MEWAKSLGVAALKGAVVACGAMAATMATDGLSIAEARVLASVAAAGALAGLSTLFQTPPRDPERRERKDD